MASCLTDSRGQRECCRAILYAATVGPLMRQCADRTDTCEPYPPGRGAGSYYAINGPICPAAADQRARSGDLRPSLVGKPSPINLGSYHVSSKACHGACQKSGLQTAKPKTKQAHGQRSPVSLIKHGSGPNDVGSIRQNPQRRDNSVCGSVDRDVIGLHGTFRSPVPEAPVVPATRGFCVYSISESVYSASIVCADRGDAQWWPSLGFCVRCGIIPPV